MRGALGLAFAIALVACSGHHDEAAPSHTGSASAGSGSARPISVDAGAAPVVMGSDGLPVECAEWRAALAKLETCTAYPANARASLRAEYDAAAKDFAALPPQEKAHLGPICKSGSESVLEGAKATCQW